MPIFQTIADYDKWRRRELRKKLLQRAAEGSVVHLASEAGGDSAFYQRYGKYVPKQLLKGTERGKETTGGNGSGGKKSVLNPKGGPGKGKSPAQRDSGPQESQITGFGFSVTTGTPPGWNIQGENNWQLQLSNANTGNNLAANAESASVSPDYDFMKYADANPEYVYGEFHINTNELTNGVNPDQTRNFRVGFKADSNGLGSATGGTVGIGFAWNGSSWRLDTNPYSGSDSYPRSNDNPAINNDWTASEYENGATFGVLVQMGLPKAVWTHVNGVWTTTGAQGGDPDAGGPGYSGYPTGGTLWLCHAARLNLGFGFDEGNTDLIFQAVTPRFTPALATQVVT